MKKRTIITAMLATMILSGCSNGAGENEESTTSLPIAAWGDNLGSVSKPTETSSTVSSTKYYLNTPSGEGVNTTPPEVGGTIQDENGEQHNLVPETGAQMENRADISQVYINGSFFDINNDIKVSEVIACVASDANGEMWNCPSGNESISDDFEFRFIGRGWGMPIVYNVEKKDDDEDTDSSEETEETRETAVMQDYLYIEAVKDGEIVKDWIEAKQTSTEPFEYDFTVYDKEGYKIKAIGDKVTNDRKLEPHIPVVFAGDVVVGQAKEEATEALGDGYEIQVACEDTISVEKSFIYSFYKTDEATLMIKYACDEYLDEDDKPVHVFTEDGGWYVNSVILFRNTMD